MDTDLENRVQVKLFIGFLLTSEIRMHLNDSREWEMAHTQSTQQENPLQESYYQNQHYIGLFCSKKEMVLAELKQLETSVRKELEVYCPTLDIDKFEVSIFPQLFIT